jgi:folate receptor
MCVVFFSEAIDAEYFNNVYGILKLLLHDNSKESQISLAHFPITYNCMYLTLCDLFKACTKYMINQVCFYQCEPNLIKWAWSAGKGYIKGAPICSDYCDRWFEACKYDRTYSDNWFDDYKINNYKNGPHIG